MTQSKRAHERYERRLAVKVVADGRELEGTTVNISLGGMFVSLAEPVKFGSTIKASFRLPALKEDTVITSTVRWVTPDGIGIQFGSLRAMEVWALNQLFKTVEAG